MKSGVCIVIGLCNEIGVKLILVGLCEVIVLYEVYGFISSQFFFSLKCRA